MEKIENRIFDEERALYNVRDTEISACKFDGPADGESVLKECRDISVNACYFNLRYPFWHDEYISIENSQMTELCRAALWYTHHADISDTVMHGIKALRECSDIKLAGCDIVSPEFGWSVSHCDIENSKAVSEYFMMRSQYLRVKNLHFTGKYSFQYVRDAVIEDSVLDTKDAFWHSENVTVKNCVVKGEYLGWYADHLTFINCKISGTQPLCYCKNLKLIDCEMTDTDLSFEKSDVEADLTAPIISIKNPIHGYINVPAVGEIIIDDAEAAKKECKVTVG